MVEPDTWAELVTFRRQYFQVVEPSQLRWPEGHAIKNPEVQSWIFNHLFDTERNPTLPPDRYRLRVLKVLISKLETAINDPEEDVVRSELSCDVLVSERIAVCCPGIVLVGQPTVFMVYSAASKLWCSVLHWIDITQAEGTNTFDLTISDDLMAALSSILGSNVLSEFESAQQKAYVTYAYPRHTTNGKSSNDYSVTLLESRSVISSSGTTGLRTWEAALLLGQFLSSDHGDAMVRGKRVFELGAGTGMLSILCAKHLGVSGIVATDGDEAVVDAIKTNIFLNEVDASRVTVNTAALRWGRSLNATTFAEDYGMEQPDVLLGADVTYEPIVIPVLVSTMREFFELNAALQVLVAATIRNEQTFETFLNACRRNRFTLQQIDFAPLPEHLQDGPFYPTATPIQIWRITRAHTAQDPFAF